jgi:uncharacterized SAM-binding protein YcdF (DUF218 family)
MFALSKFVQIALEPGHILVALLVLGVVLLIWRRSRRAGTRLIVIATILFVVIAVFPVGAWLLAPLEERFPPPETMPAEVAGIVVLGGGQDARVTVERDRLALDQPAERMIETAALMRRYPDAVVVFTGGLGFRGTTEADIARQALAMMGADVERVLFEDTARNTYENALQTYELVRPDTEATWLLVTSATHMPRAMASFRKVGWRVVPYPVDYRTGLAWTEGGWFSLAQHLTELDMAVHEYVGLVSYWALDRSDDPWPEP